MRLFTHTRGLTLAVVVTLACGVALLTATFAIVDAALVRQPPFVEANRLALLSLQRNPMGEPPRQERWSFARFERLRQLQKSACRRRTFPCCGSPRPAAASSMRLTTTRRGRRRWSSSDTTRGKYASRPIQPSSGARSG